MRGNFPRCRPLPGTPQVCQEALLSRFKDRSSTCSVGWEVFRYQQEPIMHSYSRTLLVVLLFLVGAVVVTIQIIAAFID